MQQASKRGRATEILQPLVRIGHSLHISSLIHAAFPSRSVDHLFVCESVHARGSSTILMDSNHDGSVRAINLVLRLCGPMCGFADPTGTVQIVAQAFL